MAECRKCKKKGLFFKVNNEGLCKDCEETMVKDACPYCGSVLEKIPKRKSQCPHCNNYIFIRKKKMVTEKMAVMLDFLRDNEFYGAHEKEYLEIEEEKKKSFGFEPKPNDVVWTYYNKLIKKNSRNYQNLKSIYYAMAIMLNKEKKDFFHLLQESNKMELLDYKGKGFIKKVKISTAGKGNACDNCLKLEGKTFTINEALEKMPLPNKNCSHTLNKGKIGFCRCMYISKI